MVMKDDDDDDDINRVKQLEQKVWPQTNKRGVRSDCVVAVVDDTH